MNKDKWKVVRIGDVCEDIFAGGDVPVHRFSKIKSDEYRFPIYSNGEKDDGLYGYTDIKKVTKPSLTISARGTIGYSVIREENFFPAVRLIVLIPNREFIGLMFLKYVIGIIKFASSGTSIPQLTVPMVKKYEIPLPPLEEQIQIASLFKSIEEAVEQVEGQERSLNELLKALSNDLLKEKPRFGNLLSDENCRSIKFKQIADCIEQHDKLKKEVTRFIGLENIESGILTIETWGDIEKGTTFTKKFSKGDVLFGKRRAYLKKVAVAEFDGICSGDILVFRAKEEVILPGLLPYYVAAEPFIQYAVTTSAGSLSPRTKWKDLAEFQLSIPDLNAQKRVLELFQQFQTTIRQLKQQKMNLIALKHNLLGEVFG